MMMTRQDVVQFCLSLTAAYEDYPFDDFNWTVMRHRENRKTFALIFERNGYIWINVKCEPLRADFWRSNFSSVVPGYHMNKEHWNSIILDGAVPDEMVQAMIFDSFELTKPKLRPRLIRRKKEEFLPLLLLADPDDGMIARYLGHGDLFAVSHGGEAVCCAVVLGLNEMECELKNLAVAECCQDQGIGTRMMEFLFQRYAKEYEWMLVGTSAGAKPFYEKLGFTYSHTLPGFFLQYPEPVIEDGAQLTDMLYFKKQLRGDKR